MADPLEVLQFGLCLAAKQGALEALAGRRATPEQLERIAEEFTREVTANAARLAKDTKVTDEDLAQAARASGQAAVVRVLGPLRDEEMH